MIQGGMPKMSILQKTALSLGVNTEAGTFDPIIPRLSPLTDKLLTKSKIFETTVNDQTVMEFKAGPYAPQASPINGCHH